MHLNIEISSKDQSRGFRFSLVAAGEKGQCCQSVFAEQALPQADSTGHSVHQGYLSKSTAEERALLLHIIPVSSHNSC